MNAFDIIEQQYISTNRNLIAATIHISDLQARLDEANRKLDELTLKTLEVGSSEPATA